MRQEMLVHFDEILRERFEGILPGATGSLFCPEKTGADQDPMDEADLAFARNEREFSMQIHQRNRGLLREITDALFRIRKGEFGICEECGSDIEIKRLKAQPTAAECIDCKRRLEAQKRLKAA